MHAVLWTEAQWYWILNCSYKHLQALITKVLRLSAAQLPGCTGPQSADGQQLPGAGTLPRQHSPQQGPLHSTSSSRSVRKGRLRRLQLPGQLPG